MPPPSDTRTTPPAINVADLVVHRGGTPVLPSPGLSCSIPAGTVTGLLGPSGSGKTTLMRAIVGVQRTRSGEVTVLGKPAGDPALRHRVGYLTQAPSVYEDLTVRANVRYFATLYDVGRTEAEASIADVDLGGEAHKLVRDLSGGQRTRASLACALVARPELLVLDEPTVGQDPVLRRDLWAHFHRLAAQGITLLVSSHVMDEAARCDRLLLIREGRIVADATPDELRERTGTADMDEAFLRVIEGGAR